MTASTDPTAGPSISVVATAGAVSLAVAMGVGRFAFTPLLPMMLRDATIDIALGSWLATANYLGYLAGALLTTRVPNRLDARLVLAVCYTMQGIGVVLTLFVSSLAGFIVSSVLVGLFITSISFFAMQEARRLRPHHTARFMGLLTALYGIGQIAGPPLTAALLARLPSRAEGFGWSLGIASAALAAGACLYVLMYFLWPKHKPETAS